MPSTGDKKINLKNYAFAKMNTDITIKPKFPLDETLKAQLKFYYSSWSSKRLFIYIIIMLVILGISVFRGKEIDILLIVGPIIILGIIIFSHFSTKNRIRKAILKNPRLKEDITFIFNTNEFIEKGETFEVNHKWSEYEKIKEVKDYFFLYVDKKSAILLKKEDFKDQLARFKELILTIPIKTDFKSI